MHIWNHLTRVWPLSALLLRRPIALVGIQNTKRWISIIYVSLSLPLTERWIPCQRRPWAKIHWIAGEIRQSFKQAMATTKRNEKMRETSRRRWQRNQTKPNRIVSNEKRMCKHAHSTVLCIKHWLSQIEGDKLVASNDTWNNSYKHTTCCKCAWHIRCCVPSCPRPIHAECVCNDHFRLVLCEDLVRQLQFIFVCLLAITNIIEPVAPLYIVVFGHFWLPLSSISFHLIRV